MDKSLRFVLSDKEIKFLYCMYLNKFTKEVATSFFKKLETAIRFYGKPISTMKLMHFSGQCTLFKHETCDNRLLNSNTALPSKNY